MLCAQKTFLAVLGGPYGLHFPPCGFPASPNLAPPGIKQACKPGMQGR